MYADDMLRFVGLAVIYHCSLSVDPQVPSSIGQESVGRCLHLTLGEHYKTNQCH